MASSDLVLVIGGGSSGIAIAHSMKYRIRHINFIIIERTDSIGGTWSEDINNYPGCEVDIPSHFYCFSFNPNPDWSHTYCGHEELSRYVNDTVDKFGLRQYFMFDTEVTTVKWETYGEKRGSLLAANGM